MLDGQVESLDLAVKAAAEKNEKARLLMSQPGVGPVTSLAFVLTMGDVSAFSAGQAGGQLSGTDPAGVQFGRTSAAGIDQQARQPVYENAVGGGGASSGALRSADFATSICIAATASQREWRKWRRQGSWRFDSTGCWKETRYPEIVRIESSSRVPLVGAS